MRFGKRRERTNDTTIRSETGFRIDWWKLRRVVRGTVRRFSGSLGRRIHGDGGDERGMMEKMRGFELSNLRSRFRLTCMMRGRMSIGHDEFVRFHRVGRERIVLVIGRGSDNLDKVGRYGMVRGFDGNTFGSVFAVSSLVMDNPFSLWSC